MIVFWEQLVAGRIGIFVIFAFTAWFVWSVRLWYSLGYKPWTNEITNYRVTMVIPTYHESRETLEKSICALKANRINGHEVAEIIVVMDAREMELKDWLDEKFPFCRVLVAPPGKRWAVRMGIEAASYDKVGIVESDTFADPDAVQELMRPLEDPEVGGVVAFQRVYNPKENMCTRLMDWMESLKYRISVPGLSKNGVVNVLGGRLVVFNRELVLPLLPRLTGERFLGKPCVAGDDGRLTSLLLEAGWKSIYQSTSHCYTVSPNTWRSLLRQRLRWQRNSNRRIINAFKDGWVFRRHWTLGFQMASTFVMPFFFGLIVVKTIQLLFIYPLINGMWESGLVRLGIFLVGITVTRGIRTYPHLANARYDIILLPFYALYLIFLMWPVRMFSFLTLNQQGWITRQVASPGGMG
ncbi:MAG: glycosyltransferase [Dehalococcoidia bacterium]|nr:glycosyltransferase [Dehalococcoidia bacterium]